MTKPKSSKDAADAARITAPNAPATSGPTANSTTTINTDDNDSTHPRKRQRVSQACDQCRSRRNKCDGKQPSCSVCLPLGRPCTYGSNPKKRGLPTGYVRGLEIMWGSIFLQIDGSQDAVAGLLKGADGGKLRAAMLGKDASTADELLDSWRKSAIAKEIENLLSGAENGGGEKNESMADLTSPVDLNNIKWQLPPGAVAVNGTPSRVDGPVQSSSAWADDHVHQPVKPRPATESELPSHTFGLLETYFAYTHSWFPIIEKTDILRLSYSNAPERAAHGGGHMSGHYAALWAILAYTSAQNKTTPVDLSMNSKSGGPELSPAEIYQRARQYIPPEDEPYDIGHVQALLLLSLLQVAKRAWSAAWLFVGQAVRAASNLGITNRTNAEEDMRRSATVGKRHKHVGLGCFVLDTLISSRLGRKAYLSRMDATRLGHLDEDGLEEWAPWIPSSGVMNEMRGSQMGRKDPVHTLSCFNHLVTLMGIASDINTTIPRGFDPQPLAEELRAWHQRLPPHSQLSPHTTCPAPPILVLHLGYLATHSSLQAQLQRLRNPHLQPTNLEGDRDIELQISHVISSVKGPWPGLDVLSSLFLSQPAQQIQQSPRNGTNTISHSHNRHSFSSSSNPTNTNNGGWFGQQPAKPVSGELDMTDRRSMGWPPTPTSHEQFAASPNSSINLSVDHNHHGRGGTAAANPNIFDNTRDSPGNSNPTALAPSSFTRNPSIPNTSNPNAVTTPTSQQPPSLARHHSFSDAKSVSSHDLSSVQNPMTFGVNVDPFGPSGASPGMGDNGGTAGGGPPGGPGQALATGLGGRQGMRSVTDEMEAFFDEMAMLDGQDL